MKICSAEDCTTPARASGLCAKHYMRQRRHGDTSVVGKPGRPPVYPGVTQMMNALRGAAIDLSDTALRRMAHASILYHELGGDYEAAVARAERKHGTVNTTQLWRDALIFLVQTEEARRRLQHGHPDLRPEE
jgi:hypothetical protein